MLFILAVVIIERIKDYLRERLFHWHRIQNSPGYKKDDIHQKQRLSLDFE